MRWFRELYNGLMPCPNEKVIWKNNSDFDRRIRIERYHLQLDRQRREVYGKKAVEILGGVAKELQEAGIPEVQEEAARLEAYAMVTQALQTEAEETEPMENPVDDIVSNLGQISCARCEGIVVDLRNGQAYCGRDVPQRILDSNNQLTS